MKPELVEKIRCIKCGSKEFFLLSVKQETDEVLEGLVVCKKCGYAYAIVDGILRTLDDKTRRERVSKYKDMLPENLKEIVR